MSESVISERKLAANRANAKKSTGPRTARGKAVAAINGLRHGVFARDLLLAGESAEELLALKTAMIRRLNPRDPLELELVDRVISACWKLRRLQRFERLVYQRQCDAAELERHFDREQHGLGKREPVSAEMAWRSGDARFEAQLERIDTQQHRLENALHRALRQLEKLREQEIDEPISEFAAETVAAEQRQHEIWQSEATATEQLVYRAQLAAAKATREAHRQAAAEFGRWNENGANDEDGLAAEDDAEEPTDERTFGRGSEDWQGEATAARGDRADGGIDQPVAAADTLSGAAVDRLANEGLNASPSAVDRAGFRPMNVSATVGFSASSEE